MRSEALLVTVKADAAAVERRLAAGESTCPKCGAVLRGWGWWPCRRLRGPAGSAGYLPSVGGASQNSRTRCILAR